MRQVVPEASWPTSWHYSYGYDMLELYGDHSNLGYSYAYQNRARTTLELIDSITSPPASVLDVAAGQGNMSLQLAERGYEVTWNDLRADLRDYVALKHESGVVKYQPGNMFDLDPAQPFDVVLLAEVIEHVAHPDELLRKARRLTAPGGHVVITTPNGEYFRNRLPRFSDCADPSMFESEQFRPDADGHIFLLYVDEIRSLAEKAGLALTSVKVLTNPLTAGYLGTIRVLDRLPEGCVWALERSSRRLPGGLGRKLNVHLAAVLTPTTDLIEAGPSMTRSPR